jgi:Zn ribbon nucleic-acid-binding protein
VSEVEPVPASGWCEIGKRCPACQATPLLLRWGLEAKRLGSFSLAGAQMKVSARQVARVSCGACGWSVPGRFTDDARIRDGRFISGHFEPAADA